MTGRVAGKVALVTGAAMGIGKALADVLAQEGATVIVADINESEGRAVAASLSTTFVKLDVASAESWAATEAAVLQRFGGLDILINNAAIMILGSIEDVSFAQWRRVQEVNADGVFLGCQSAVRLMKARGGGSIINIASVASHQGEPYAAAYCASKGAVRSLTKAVAVHCQQQGYNIRCNSIHPGAMATPMVREIRAQRGLAGDAPGAGDPRQVAYAALYLASDESRLVTGAELLVDGGRTITPPPPAP